MYCMDEAEISEGREVWVQELDRIQKDFWLLFMDVTQSPELWTGLSGKIAQSEEGFLEGFLHLSCGE